MIGKSFYLCQSMLKHAFLYHSHKYSPKLHHNRTFRCFNFQVGVLLAVFNLFTLPSRGLAFNANNNVKFTALKATSIGICRVHQHSSRTSAQNISLWDFSRYSTHLQSSPFVVDQEEYVNLQKDNDALVVDQSDYMAYINDTAIQNLMDLKPLEELQSFTSSASQAMEDTIPDNMMNETSLRPFFATMVPAKSKSSQGTADKTEHSPPPPIVFDGHNNKLIPEADEPSLKRQRSWRRFFMVTENNDSEDDEEGDSAKHRARKLSSLLARTASNSTAGRQYAARTITGLINALAEEVSDLDVQVDVDEDTPLHEKHIKSVKIEFSTLGFKPLWLGGHHSVKRPVAKFNETLKSMNHDSEVLGPILGDVGTNETTTVTADEAFDQMDADKSGFIDYDELLQTLSLIASRSAGVNNTADKQQILPILKNLASDLFRLYDKNGDGVVDRKEYKRMVDDMAALTRESDVSEQKPSMDHQGSDDEEPLHRKAMMSVKGLIDRVRGRAVANDEMSLLASNRSNETTGEAKMKRAAAAEEVEGMTENVVDAPELVESLQKSIGSIVFSDVKMDLRRLVFGALPVVKKFLPGGPLILEPFTTTITGSFNREEIMKSVLLDAALRRLVMRTLRKRVGFVRDFMEGSVFRGRSWKTFGGEGGPQVEVPRLTDIEFDKNGKMIVTGRAKIRTHPDSPVIEQAFKLRTRLGTRRDGRFVRLEEPELALVLECPRSWDTAYVVLSKLNLDATNNDPFRRISTFCSVLGLHKPARPPPIYSFFPIYSPFKLQDDDGFDLGADNSIKSLYIKDGALRFEMSAILRPGRFLGSHYIAFSTPIRTVIVTLDRVAEGMRAARRVKKAQNKGVKRSRRFLFLGRVEDAIMNRQDQRLQASCKPKTKGFLSRFLDGYRNADSGEADKERVTQAIREFFGRQSRGR